MPAFTVSALFPLLASATLSGGAPTALDDAFATTRGNNLSVDAPGVLDNDSDPESEPLQAILVDSSGASGNLILFPDGSLEYEVAPGFVGTDTFTYVANDGTSNSAPATITFEVTGGPTGGVLEFTDQASFLDAVLAQGWTFTQESFEDPLWPRSPATAPSVSSLGVTWTGNNASSGVTTGTGPALFGQYGFFQLPHGSYTTGTGCDTPGNCTDGWVATAEAGKFVAAGIWIHCNAGTAGIELVLDGDTANPVHFGGSALPAGSTGFFGVIDATGFASVEVHETEGVSEDASFLFADLFTFAKGPVAEAVLYGCGINPAGSMSVLSGLPELGTTVVLGIDNPLGTQPAGSFAGLALGTAPFANFPCGLPVAGYGMSAPGATGELLIDPLPPNVAVPFSSAVWPGGGPVAMPVAIPADATLAGLAVDFQGVIWDHTGTSGIDLALTDAVELRIGL